MSDQTPIAPVSDATVFLTSEEAAALLRWLPDTVRRKACAGELPGVRLGRQWRFEREKLHAYIRGERNPTRQAGYSVTGGRLAAEIFRQAPLRSAKKRGGVP